MASPLPEVSSTANIAVGGPLAISMPLPEGPGIAFSVDYVRLVPVTPRGKTTIMLFTDRFSR